MTPRLRKPLPTLVVNLDRDTDRWADTESAFAAAGSMVRLARHSGFVGATLPATARLMLCPRAKVTPGTLGCFLAHMAAWEGIVASRARWTLVLEDDVMPVGLHRLFRAELPEDAELIWVNHGMDHGGRAPGPGPVTIRPIIEGLRHKVDRPPGRRAPATDGYLITPGGAAALLAAVRRDGIRGHLDWTMLRYGLDRDAAAEVARGTWMETHPLLGPDRDGLGWGVVRAYSASPRVIGHRRNVPSTRVREDAVATPAPAETMESGA